MTVHQRLDYPAERLTRRAESLVMLAYRCWQAGYDYADTECWNYAWTVLSNELGPREARPLLNAVEDLVRALRQATGGRVDYYPPPCCRTSAGERRLLALLSALQAGDAARTARSWADLCTGMRPPEADRVMVGATVLSRVLRAANLMLEPDMFWAAGLDRGRLH